MAHSGIGALVGVVILAELGDCRRFASSREAVRHAGPDITVHRSDQRRAPGHLSRQRPPAPRWAPVAAAQQAPRTTSPDRASYEQAAERLGGNRASPAIARRLLTHHTPRELGEEALAPARTHPGRARHASPSPMRRGQLPAFRCRHVRVGGPERPSRRNALPPATPITIMSPTRRTAGSRTEISTGAPPAPTAR
jgi:hypothetical protein